MVVVHGLGDSQPADTVRSLTRGIALVDGRSVEPVEEVHWFEEAGCANDTADTGPKGAAPQDRLIEGFLCHVARLRSPTAGKETVLAEVNWADISRLPHGALMLAIGLLRLAFGGRHLARHAADPRRRDGTGTDWAARALRAMSAFIAYLLRGPIVAALLLWVLAWLIGAAIKAFGYLGSNEAPWVAGIAIATGVVCLGAGVLGYRQGGRSTRMLFGWLGLLGIGAATVYWFWYSSGQLEKMDLSASIFFGYALASVPQAVLLFSMPVAAGAWLLARLRAPRRHRPGLDFAQWVNWFTALVFTLVVSTVIVMINAQLGGGGQEGEGWTKAFQGVLVPNFVVYWILALLFVLILLATLGARRLWTKRATLDGYDPNRPAPRLIVGNGLCAFAILSSFGPLTMPFQTFWKEAFGTLALATPIAVAVMLAIGSVAVYMNRQLRTAVDFALDFVTQFRQEPGPDGAAHVDRDRIRERLRTVLRAFIDREAPNHVTVVSHSMGTIVAIDVLNQMGSEALPGDEPKIDLVTMASPLLHIHQHYFPNDYPPLGDAKWDGLRRTTGRWLNVFRIDDPVGTVIEPGESWPKNLHVDAYGHSDYWTDRQVLQILTEKGVV